MASWTDGSSDNNGDKMHCVPKGHYQNFGRGQNQSKIEENLGKIQCARSSKINGTVVKVNVL